jgi:AraC-like DNA-binding protein
MESVLSKIHAPVDSAIFVKNDIAPFIDYPLHYHPEYELVLIDKGYGKRIVGDHIDEFQSGDLVFLSPYLPHIWKCAPEFYDPESHLTTSCFVLHFRADSFGQGFFDLPDFEDISQLFIKGNYGVLLKGNLRKVISGKLKQLHSLKGVKKIILFFEILYQISTSDEIELLASPLFKTSQTKTDNERMMKIYEFILQNYKRTVRLNELASHVNMTPTSLSRYFNKKMGRSFVEVVNEARIKFACNLLKKTEKTVLEICFESGFNNLSNFNR